MEIAINKRGQALTNAQKATLIDKMLTKLESGYMSTNQLAKELQVSRRTIDRFRPMVDKRIADKQPDRSIIRNLQIQRTYKIIEMLMNDLNKTKDDKTRQGYYNQIAKFSSHLALITGLNIETQINVNQDQLVIIRADNAKQPKQKIIEAVQD